MIKVSVITVVYNNKTFIQSAIESVLRQTYPNIEYIVIDGGSKDGTVDIIKRFEPKLAYFVSEPDKGIFDAMNKGLNLVTGDIVGYLNSDDELIDPFVIEDIVKQFRDNPSIDCCYGNLVIVDRQDVQNIKRKWVSRPFKQGLFQCSWTPAHPTFYCKPAFIRDAGGFDMQYKISADGVLMMRLLQTYKIKSHFYNRFMVRMRDGGNSNRGLASIYRITQEMLRAMKQENYDYSVFSYVFCKFLKVREILFSKTTEAEFAAR